MTPSSAVQAPTREDPVVAGLSEVIGGPIGEHAAPRHARWAAPVALLMLLTSIVVGLGFVKDTTCYDATWSNANRYTHMCYSDLPYLYTARGFAELVWPYDNDAATRAHYPVGGDDDGVMEYPVGISYWAWTAAEITHLITGRPDLSERADQSVGALGDSTVVQREIRGFVIINGLGFAVIAIISTWLLARVVRRRPWDAAAFALSPCLMATVLINWDICAVGFVAAAAFAWSRRRLGWTGVMIGLGAATKLYPLLMLGAVVVILVRKRRWGELAFTTAAAVLTWVVVNLPAYLSGPKEWAYFWKANEIRGADLGSAWLAVQGVTGHVFAVHTVNLVSWALLVIWCVVVLVVGLRAPQTPRFAQIAYLVLAGFLIVNKVYSPQYVLWLLPLAVLARPRWRDQLIWQSTELFYFAAVWWYLNGSISSAGDPGESPIYWLAIAIRIAGELWLAAMIVRDMYRPGLDPVRAAEDDSADSADETEGQEIKVSSNVVVV